MHLKEYNPLNDSHVPQKKLLAGRFIRSEAANKDAFSKLDDSYWGQYLT